MNYFHIEFEFCKALEQAGAILGRGVRKLRSKRVVVPERPHPTELTCSTSPVRTFSYDHSRHQTTV